MSTCVPDLVVAEASVDDAAAMVEVIHAAFGARPPLDPPSTAIDETPESLAATMRQGRGIFASVGGRPAGVIVVLPEPNGVASLHRVSVHPDFQRHGIASAMVAAAEELAAVDGSSTVELFARGEFAALVAFWQHRGYVPDREAPHGVILTKPLPLAIPVNSGEAMRALGARLAHLLRPGDLVIASGDLGAGKTTLTQGIGRGLGSAGPIISPTFVLSRVHPSATGRPTLVHVDAYRLSTPAELDDLDLEATVAESVTVVEWGQGIAEGLASDRLEVDLWAGTGESDRIVVFRGVGARWDGVDLTGLRDGDRG
ncbi:MAG TPA: tRNA (adenosine(37)-N6)-threonylcarbamoyltransferase complex ATPase subunit type 1 TsaE [Pseudonocardia sp.]|nr:tRNA (adenosine(37)-N6)-threonylcarbamoyltransferase complex ATPase subunit type 1 TsaE [Pseudonocardia sp.]